jgi:hypothetical protein
MKFYLPLTLATAFLAPSAYAQSCEATGSDLNLAKETFAQVCPDMPRADCDPIGGGQWTCSSEKIGNAAPSSTVLGSLNESVVESVVESAVEPAVEPVADPAPEVELPETTSSECVAVGSNLTLAIEAYEASCMAPRVDCDPIDEGWSCSSGVIGSAAPNAVTLAAPTPTTVVAPVVVETPAPVVAPVVVVDPVAPVTGTYTGPVPQASWRDSYSVNGVCYIDGGYDHNARNMNWTIDGVTRTVGEWIPYLKTGPGRGNNHTYLVTSVPTQ